MLFTDPPVFISARRRRSSPIFEATRRIHEAHELDKGDLGGHAERAIQLLDQASREVKSASELEHASHK